MVLVLDHLVKDERSGQPPGGAPELRQRSDSTASDRSVTSDLPVSKLDCVGSTFRARMDSGASERSVSSESHVRHRLSSDVSDSGSRLRLGSGASDSIGLLPRKRTDSGTSDHSVSMSSEERSPAEEDSETETGGGGPAGVEAQPSRHDPDGAVLSPGDAESDLTSGQKQEVVYSFQSFSGSGSLKALISLLNGGVCVCVIPQEMTYFSTQM